MKAIFRMASGIVRSGTIIKENFKTIIVKLPEGKIIKRHKTKHGVIFLC